MALVFDEQLSRLQKPDRDEMTDEEFEAMIGKSMDDVRQGKCRPAEAVFADLRKGLTAHGV